MRYLILAVLCLLALAVAAPAQTTTPVMPKRHNCTKLYTQAQFRGAARKVYRSASRVSGRETKQIKKFIRCQHSDRASRAVRKQLRGYKRGHRIRVEWHFYKTHPMPGCTWRGESGPPSRRNPEWSGPRYRRPNSQGSAASGKYQIMDGTWIGYGGTDRGKWHDAAKSPPIEQEKIAHRIHAAEGTSPWEAC